MSGFAYYNGKFGKKEDICIPLSDRAIYFGDGIYDAAIGESKKIFLADEHIARFLGNAKKLEINHPYTHDDIAALLSECVLRAGYESFFLYFQLSRNADKRSHSHEDSNGVNLLITVENFTLPAPEKSYSLITVDDLRYFYCDIKTLNLLPAVLAAGKASKSGADEAVFHRGGIVTECAHSNISILKDGKLYTHPTNNLILPGITRHHLLIACRALGIEYSEEPYSLSELFSADEVLICSTTKLCGRVTEIDGVRVGGRNKEAANKICDYVYEEFVHFIQS